MTNVVPFDGSLVGLPQLCDAIATSLSSARSAAEILAARVEAEIVWSTASHAAKFHKAGERLRNEARVIQARAAELAAIADTRLADEYRAAQARGEARTRGGDRTSKQSKLPDGKFGPSDVGLTEKQLHQARQLRDAEKAEPGVIKRLLHEELEAGREPSLAKVRRKLRPMMPKLDPQVDALMSLEGAVRVLLARLSTHPTSYLLGGFRDDKFRQRTLAMMRECRDKLTVFIEDEGETP